MGRRYYCEYCDKSFSDNPTTRKNHMKGGIHQKNKKIHYDSFREPSVILREEMGKKPCRKFAQGDCHFGENCLFSHLTEERRHELEAQIVARHEAKKKRSNAKEPNLDDWLAKRVKKDGDTSKDSQIKPEPKDTEPDVPVFHLPVTLSGYTNLPPSVIPPTPHDMMLPSEAEWG